MAISALVPEIIKFEKCINYANEMSDNIIHSTQYYITSMNRAVGFGDVGGSSYLFGDEITVVTSFKEVSGKLTPADSRYRPKMSTNLNVYHL